MDENIESREDRKNEKTDGSTQSEGTFDMGRWILGQESSTVKFPWPHPLNWISKDEVRYRKMMTIMMTLVLLFVAIGIGRPGTVCGTFDLYEVKENPGSITFIFFNSGLFTVHDVHARTIVTGRIDGKDQVICDKITTGIDDDEVHGLLKRGGGYGNRFKFSVSFPETSDHRYGYLVTLYWDHGEQSFSGAYYAK
jgi:hypothetical protein